MDEDEIKWVREIAEKMKPLAFNDRQGVVNLEKLVRAHICSNGFVREAMNYTGWLKFSEAKTETDFREAKSQCIKMLNYLLELNCNG